MTTSLPLGDVSYSQQASTALVQSSQEPQLREAASCWEKYDQWSWNSGQLFRRTKVTNCIKQSPCASCGSNCLFVYRGCVALVYWVVWFHDSINNFHDWGFFALQYFTVWGVWLTTGYFNFAFFTEVRYRWTKEEVKDDASFLRAWKWVSAIFITAILWECVIASVYWTLLYPGDREKFEGHPGKMVWNCFDHAVPITVLTIDWFLNRIYFEWNQVYVNMLVFVVYGLVNLTVTKVTGEPVYGPISWDSVLSWFTGLAMLPLAFGFYVGLYYLTRYKFRKMHMHDAIEYQPQPSIAQDQTMSYGPNETVDQHQLGLSGQTQGYNNSGSVSSRQQTD